MHRRTTVPGLRRSSTSRPPSSGRRPSIYLGVAVAGAALVSVAAGTGPAAQAEADGTGSVSVAQQLGLDADRGPVDGNLDVSRDLGPLQDLAASRSARDEAAVAAQFAQAAADQTVLDQRRAEEEAARRAAEEAAAARRAAEQRAAEQAAAARPAPRGPVAAAAQAAGAVVASARARISNSAGAIDPRAQAAADAVVSNVPGAGSITLGGTRASAADPGGHPSGLAVDYMVLSDRALGDAIVAYHVAHWNELGVEYLIYQQRMMSSPGGGWTPMENRGGATANHMDHVHVNYR
jgi:hypothetical protein